MTGAELLAVEQALLEAWPAHPQQALGGWVLRAGRGGYGRLNSVWTGRSDPSPPLDEKIARAEAFYRHAGLPPRFQVLETAEPAGLDDALAQRGYVVLSSSHMMTKPVRAESPPPGISLSPEPGEGWMRFYLAEQNSERAAEFTGSLGRLPARRVFATLRRDGEEVSGALAIAVGLVVAIECVATRPDQRGRGAVAAVLAAIEAWSGRIGADRMALQVSADNAPALAAYARAGFERSSGYHYRALPLSGAASAPGEHSPA